MASPGALGGLARRCTASIARRGGAGLKVDMRPPPSQKLVEEDELTWDDGSTEAEPALDEHKYGTWEAVGKLAVGFGFFGAVGYAAAYLHERNPAPFAKPSRAAVLEELGGERLVPSAKPLTDSDQ
mmetsp:Transcript_7168/g.26355  ORF Transcript_7168/g.26355 Transcript_7168/m.26355 type:complete len:126 (+) Transcript_7168:288-665(+)